MWSTVRLFLQDEDRCFMAGTITLFTPPPPSYLKFIHNKVRILVRGGGVFISHCFLISSVFSHMPSSHNFLPAARDKLLSIVSCCFFFHPLWIQDLGFFWMKTSTFPSVREICSSNRCIQDESFCSMPKPKSQLTYHSLSHP